MSNLKRTPSKRKPQSTPEALMEFFSARSAVGVADTEIKKHFAGSTGRSAWRFWKGLSKTLARSLQMLEDDGRLRISVGRTYPVAQGQAADPITTYPARATTQLREQEFNNALRAGAVDEAESILARFAPGDPKVRPLRKRLADARYILRMRTKKQAESSNTQTEHATRSPKQAITFGSRIEELKRECGYSYKKLAIEARIDTSTIFRNMKEGTKPNAQSLHGYARVFSKCLGRDMLPELAELADLIPAEKRK